jgi:hypothetical protein
MDSKEIITEYCKCYVDPIYAIETYLRTQDVTSNGYVDFNLFPKQKELIASYEEFQKTIATKSRQAGVTTVTTAYFAVKAMLASQNNPQKIVIIANKLESSKKILAQVREFIEQLSEHNIFYIDADKPTVNIKKPKKVFSVDSKIELVLSHNKSSIKAISSGLNASRTLTATWLLFDEAAFIEKGKIIYSAASPTISTGGKVSMISTANGRDELYYPTYVGALNKSNGYNLVEMRWYQDPRYNKGLKWIKGDEIIKEIEFTIESYQKMIDSGYKPTSSWYEEACALQNGNERAIAQEIDVNFLNSGANVLSQEIQDMQKRENVIIDPPYKDGKNEDIWIWKRPEEVIGHRIVLSVDPSSGSGDDFGTMELLDIDYVDGDGNVGIEQIVQYYGKLKPDEISLIALEYALAYDAYVVVDCIGGWGYPTISLFMQQKYKKLYYDTLSNVNTLFMKNKTNYGSNSNKPAGFHNGALRETILGKFESYTTNNILKIRSIRTYNELQTWVWKNNRRDHTRTAHDDSITAIALGLFVSESSNNLIRKSVGGQLNNLTFISSSEYNTSKTKQRINVDQIVSKVRNVSIFGGSYGSSTYNAQYQNSMDITDSTWVMKKQK